MADIAAMLIDIYGSGYSAHPCLANLLDLNRISRLNVLSGGEEATAFEAGEHVKLRLPRKRRNACRAYTDDRVADLARALSVRQMPSVRHISPSG